MNSGSFFRLNIEASNIAEGIAIFEYTDLPDLDSGDDMLMYPIRLFISSNNVFFFIHFYCDEGSPRHSEEVILTLPYGTRSTEALSSIIKRIYNTTFPLSDYLQELMQYRYEKGKENDEDVVKRKKEKYKSIRESLVNYDSYSSLFVWGLLDGNDNYSLQDEATGKNKRVLRKILLDFMFDLMHSDVFENSKYYSQMREGLMYDFFFSSIVKKSEYYYNRRLVRRRFQSDENKEEDISVIKNLYAEKLDLSEAEWVDVIMNPLADMHFSYSPKWYENHKTRARRKGLFGVAESWFVNPEEEMARVVFPLKSDDVKVEHVHYLNSYELYTLIKSKNNSSDVNNSLVEARNTMVSRWFFRRFDFDDTLGVHLPDNWNQILAFLLSVFCVVGCVPAFWTSPHNIALFPLVASIVFFIAFLFSLDKKAADNSPKRIDDVFLKNRRKRNRRISLRLSVLFLTICAFLFFYESSNLQIFVVKLIGALVVVALIIFVPPRVHIIDNIHLLLPRLVASITAAWVMLVIGNDLVKEYLSWPACGILLIIVFVFVLYESKRTLPNSVNWHRIWRALELLIISFSISLIIGVFAINILIPSFLHDTQGIIIYEWVFVDGCKGLTLNLFPEYLARFSFLAMFIGVFIQMIFEDKKITEM